MMISPNPIEKDDSTDQSPRLTMIPTPINEIAIPAIVRAEGTSPATPHASSGTISGNVEFSIEAVAAGVECSAT
jgi:hypothetical protein